MGVVTGSVPGVKIYEPYEQMNEIVFTRTAPFLYVQGWEQCHAVFPRHKRNAYFSLKL